MKNRFVTAIAAVALFVSANTALASLVLSFDLSTGNPALVGYPGPYATVTVSWVDSTHATISFAGDSTASYAYRFGGAGAAGVNVNAASWIVSGLTGVTSPGFSGPSLSDGGASNLNGFGSFNQTFTEFDGAQYSLASVSFTLTNNSGTWADAEHVLSANANGALAGAHIFAFSNPATCCSALTTGFAAGNGGGSPPNETPEPRTLALVAVGLLGLTIVRKRAIC